MTAAVDFDQVHIIAQEVFAAMIDGEEGLLLPWAGDLPELVEPVVAWVDLHGDITGRAALITTRPVAHDLARALLDLPDGEHVSDEDLADAFGEIANVVGGNLKALLPNPGRLGLPVVAAELPLLPDTVRIFELRLSWHGRPLVVEIWTGPVAPSM